MPEFQRFGSYVLLRKIAAGGMAELYKAKKSGEKGFEKLFAVKTILPHMAMNEEFIAMLVDEAKVAALLEHQNIVHIYDLGKIEDSYCIVMEYVRGRDLRKTLARAAKSRQPLSAEHACQITASALSGLAYAHNKTLKGKTLGIVHRDISPQNIIISYDGDVKLLDFGIAKASTKSSETKAGVLKGKLSYMSPEQARGKPIDHRSDIFSTGVVFYEMLTGKKLFSGDSDLNTLRKVCAAKVEPLSTGSDAPVHPELEAIVMKSLAKDPAQRYQSASEMDDALRGFMREAGYKADQSSLGGYMRQLFGEEAEAELHEDEALYGSFDTGEILPERPVAPPSFEEHHTITDGILVGLRENTTDRKDGLKGQAPAAASKARLYKWGAGAGLAILAVVYGVSLIGVREEPKAQGAPQAVRTPPPVAVQAAAQPAPPPPPPAAPPSAPLREGARRHTQPKDARDASDTPSTGRAAISSEPSGAKVYVDQRLIGTTPVDMDGVEPYRRHDVKITMDGYEVWLGGFIVDPGQTDRLNASLVKPRKKDDKEDFWKNLFPKNQ